MIPLPKIVKSLMQLFLPSQPAEKIYRNARLRSNQPSNRNWAYRVCPKIQDLLLQVGTSSLSITWELVRKTNAQDPPQRNYIRYLRVGSGSLFFSKLRSENHCPGIEVLLLSTGSIDGWAGSPEILAHSPAFGIFKKLPL